VGVRGVFTADKGFALLTWATDGFFILLPPNDEILRKTAAVNLPPTRTTMPPGRAKSTASPISLPARSPPLRCLSAALGFTFAPFLFLCAISIFLYEI
jgi:hypothetical protein